MSKHGMSEKDLAGLGAEERAALEAEPSEDEIARGGATTAAAADDDEGEGEGNPHDTDKEDKPVEAKPAAEGKPAGDGKPAGEAAAGDGEGEEAEASTDKAPFAVPFHHESQIKAEEAKAAIDALQAKYAGGDIELADFLAKRDEIRSAVMTDEIATRISETSKEQTAKALWDSAVNDFLDDNKAYRTDEVLYDALNERVKRLAADEKNADLSDKQLLKKAHEEIAKRFRIDEPAPKPKDPKAAAAAARKPDLSGAPPNLAHTPAAAENDTADDEFSALDRLAQGDSAAYERALARMPKDKQDLYLRGGVPA